MDDKLGSFLMVALGCVFLFVGAKFGTGSLYYIIPAIAAIFVCAMIYKAVKKRFEARHIGEAFWAFVALSIAIFVLVFFGNCIGSCTKGGGDTRQQRIEMGLPMY